MDPQFEATLQKAIAEPSTKKAAPAAAAAGGPKVDLRKETQESLSARSGKELKQIAAQNHIDITGCLEKPEIIAKLLMH